MKPWSSAISKYIQLVFCCVMEKLLIFNICEIQSGVMYSSCKRSTRRNTTWSAIYISLQRNIPKFDTVLLHSNWSSLRRKYLSKIPTEVNALSCGAKTWNISGISDAISPARHPQKSSQHVRACAAGDGAICSKNRIIVPYQGDNPNTWNGALTVSIPDYGSCSYLIPSR